MGLYRKIADLFRLPIPTNAITNTEQVLQSQQLQEDPGKFIYEDDGFLYPFKDRDEKLKWAAIERIVGYKLDLMTTDEICLDIFSGSWKITYSESLPGWYQLLIKLQQVFPSIPANWDGHIMQPPFATNYTVLYEREDRILPQSINFYAWLDSKSPITVVTIFEEQGWGIRKAGWTEWEMINTWSELHLEPDSEGILLNGLVALHPDNMGILNQLLDRLGVAFQYEFYDAQKQVLLEKRHS